MLELSRQDPWPSVRPKPEKTGRSPNRQQLPGSISLRRSEKQRFSRLTSLEEEFYYGIRETFLDPGILPKNLRLKWELPELRFLENRLVMPGLQDLVLVAVPMRLSCIGSLIRGGSRLLESFLGHHLIEEPSDEGLHSHFLIRKIFSINTKGAMAWVLLSANLG